MAAPTHPLATRQCTLFIFLQDESLQHKIDLEMKIHDGTTKLLQACCSTPAPATRQTTQLLEAAKSLVVTERRMKAYSGKNKAKKANDASSLNESFLCMNGFL